MSSAQVVGRMRRLLGEKRVGHAGTLDPQAAGVLIVCAGRATRLIPYLRSDKVYLAQLTLGISTDTLDAWGEVIARREAGHITQADVEAALAPFRSDILQVPPMYSALKRGGRPLYELARRGEEVERQARPVHISALELMRRDGATQYMLRVACSSGTYIRTLCEDIGEALGCGGHMSFLVRAEACGFSMADALTLEELEALAQRGAIWQAATPPEDALGHIPSLYADPKWRKQLNNGVPIPSQAQAGQYRVLCGEEFLGMGAVENGQLKMTLLYAIS